MMEWSSIEDATRLRENIDYICSSFRGVNNIVKGDVVVVNIPTPFQSDDGSERAFVYGRHTGARKNGLYEFFINPDESKRVLVEAKNVFPITPHMKDLIRDIATINSMVQNPADQFDSLLKGNCQRSGRIFGRTRSEYRACQAQLCGTSRSPDIKGFTWVKEGLVYIKQAGR
jgi:hypothetical protein